MNVNQHRQRHIKLHRALDELLADYITHTGRRVSNSTTLELMEWSYQQTLDPTSDNELPLSENPHDADCVEEDQGFTLISDGCYMCPRKADGTRPRFIKRKSPGNASLKDGGPLYWVCPVCEGYYGEVR